MASTSLIEAAKTGDITEITRRLEAGEDVNGAANGGPALWWAAASGQTESARVLIEWGANISEATSGYTPYKMANDSGHAATAALIAGSRQQPRRLPTPTGPVETWTPVGAASVAFVGIYPGLERKLTHIFNFETRERILLSQDIKTRTEAVGPFTSFDDLPPQAVEKALDQFARLGGTTDRDFALHGSSSLGKQKVLTKPETPHG